MRFACGVLNNGLAFREHRSHDRVLGCGDRRFVKEDLHPDKLVRAEREDSVNLNLGAERTESEEVGVQAAPTDHVAARWRHLDFSGSGKKRAREQD